MGNMAYCRFQNTLRDLRDCNDHLWDDDLPEEEERARKRLIALCQEIAADAGVEDTSEDEGG